MYQNNCLVLVILLFSHLVFSQEIIYLENPSFEGYPQHSQLPEFWFTCENGESPPDTQPGFFEVDNEAFDGATYAGLCTRHNGTYEVLKLEFKSPLEKDVCYQWGFYISQSPEFESISRKTLKRVPFTDPVNIVLYGSNEINCSDNLDQLAIIENIHELKNWKECRVSFKTKRTYKSLFVSVQPINREKPTNGHVLIDNFQALIPLDCEKGIPLTEIISSSTLLDEINKKEGIDKIKSLIKEIDFDYLTKNDFLKYQLYKDEEGNVKYDNVYMNELVELIKKDNRKIIMMSKNGYYANQLSFFMNAYFTQKKINGFLVSIPFQRKYLRKYKETEDILFEGRDVFLYLEK